MRGSYSSLALAGINFHVCSINAFPPATNPVGLTKPNDYDDDSFQQQHEEGEEEEENDNKTRRE